MSNVRKSHGILRDNESGGFFIVSGKVLGGDEHDKLTQQNLADDEQRISDNIADADALLKHSIVKSRDLVTIAQADAQAAANTAKKQGYAKGYDEGLSQGISEGNQLSLDERQPLINALSELSQKFSEFCERPADKYEYLDSTFELIHNIISIELAKNDNAFYGLYKKAALHISNIDKATLKVGPRGYAVVEAQKSKFESAIEGLGELTVIQTGDDDGECVLETSLGNIDVSVNAQLSRAKRIISPQC